MSLDDLFTYVIVGFHRFLGRLDVQLVSLSSCATGVDPFMNTTWVLPNVKPKEVESWFFTIPFG